MRSGSRVQQTDYSRCVGWVGPSVELCRNGKDDDYDGMEDEGAADANACGTCGPLPVKVCDGEDNDCDSTIDEA